MRSVALLLLLALAACGQSDDDSGQAGVTADEARQLNEAAAATDINAALADNESAPQ